MVVFITKFFIFKNSWWHCVKRVRIRSFSGPHAEKYGQEKLRIWTFFRQCNIYKKALFFELKIGHKTCNSLCLYRSPNQSQDDVKTFTDNLELTFKNLVQRSPFYLWKFETLILNQATGFFKRKQALKQMQLKV